MDQDPVFLKVGIYIFFMDPSRHRRPDPKPRFENLLAKDDYEDINGIAANSMAPEANRGRPLSASGN